MQLKCVLVMDQLISLSSNNKSSKLVCNEHEPAKEWGKQNILKLKKKEKKKREA